MNMSNLRRKCSLTWTLSSQKPLPTRVRLVVSDDYFQQALIIFFDSVKRGIGANLLKIDSKRKRTKAEM